MDSLPPELLRLILGRVSNVSTLRLVCQRLNNLASIMLLEKKAQSLRERVARMSTGFAERIGRSLDRNEPGVDGLLQQSAALAELEKEISALDLRVREKQASVDVLMSSELPAAQRQQLLRLCDLHSEFVCFSALSHRVAMIERAFEQRQQPLAGREEPWEGRVGRAPDLRPHVPRPRRDPDDPRGFDPYFEPDPDQFRPPLDDEDGELPDYPGMYGPPGVNNP